MIFVLIVLVSAVLLLVSAVLVQALFSVWVFVQAVLVSAVLVLGSKIRRNETVIRLVRHSRAGC